MPEIESIKNEYNELLTQLTDPELISDWKKFEELQKKKKFLERIIEKEKEIQDLESKIEEDKSAISAGEDSELVSLAETEIIQLKEKEKKLNEEFKNLLTRALAKGEDERSSSTTQEKTEREPQSVIIEIRAGTGGEEAALFAADLFKMYSRYGQLQDWKQKILDLSKSDLAGLKEIVFELKPASPAGRNGDIFSKMKYEGGVHRVQRIPITEKSGRIHTSTASVAVLPKPKEAEIKIKPEHLKIDFYRASGPGGQYVNKRETAVRITHLPTGLVVTSQTERNQLQNKENAMAILAARLLKRKEMAEEEKISGKRRLQIKWAKRAEKIRTYNFPQDRATDHRIKKSWHNLEKIMAGELAQIIEDLAKSEEQELKR